MSPLPAFDPSWIGLAAATLTTTAFAPQAIQAWRTRSTQDVSLGMFLMLVVGIALWLTYGLLIDDMPLIAANTVTLGLAGAILAAKLRFR
jgi:MtN3 and saliva related transmembrane protein